MRLVHQLDNAEGALDPRLRALLSGINAGLRR